MTTRLTNKLLRLAAVIGCAALAPVAQAAGPFHWAKSETLLNASTATDIWSYACAPTWVNPTTGLTENLTGFESRVRDKAPTVPPLLRVKVDRLTAPVVVGVQQTDPNSNTATGDGDAGGVASPMSFVAAVAGVNNTFRIYVSKSAAGTELYELDWHCLYNNRKNIFSDLPVTHPAPVVANLISIQAQ